MAMASTAYLMSLDNNTLYLLLWQYMCFADKIWVSFEEFILREKLFNNFIFWERVLTEYEWKEWARINGGENEEEFINYIKFLRPLWCHDPESKFEKCDLYLFGPTNDFFAKKLARDRPPLAKTLFRHRIQMLHPALAVVISESSPKLSEVILKGTGLEEIAKRENCYDKVREKIKQTFEQGCAYRFA